ncbi:MAG: thioredoxin domain-containing protein, partial [Candidatus Eremiobacteraeota bacterium]|nr:thioredoxin domain-containing protein [Candidatus Eremiobacteraeota bacterium]
MSHRFSPRPNRAADAGWHEWGPEAFELARTSERPILLGISAVWCHWCHVMDETTYSDPRVLELIRERYVPIRVDTDRRPEVNARYNMGGWPTTAFLSPAGEVLTGATYVPPDEFVHLLERVAEVWRDDRAEIERRLAQRERSDEAQKPPAELDRREVERIASAIVEQYDAEFGGFGDAPKFPQPDALRFLLFLYRRDRAAGRIDERLYEILARTALAMGRGGMYDHVEGGFFRYSTTRDWSIPHFEKMAEDHAGLIRFYAELYRVSGNAEFAKTLRSALRYVRTVLRDPRTGLFAGSQDADEAYFALPLEERRRREAPFVDRTVYADWNAALAAAFLAASIALDDETLTGDALAALDALCTRMLGPGGLALHFLPEDGVPQVGPILTDQVALAGALLDAHAVTGEQRCLLRAKTLADATIARFRRDDGAFVDAPTESALGNVRKAHAPLDENAELAVVLLRLSAIVREERYAEVARRALAALAGIAGRAGTFAAPYATALALALDEPLTVAVVGEAAESQALRDAALRLPDPRAIVYAVSPDDAPARGYLESST